MKINYIKFVNLILLYIYKVNKLYKDKKKFIIKLLKKQKIYLKYQKISNNLIIQKNNSNINDNYNKKIIYKNIHNNESIINY